MRTVFCALLFLSFGQIAAAAAAATDKPTAPVSGEMIEITIPISASPEKVWTALTDSRQIKQWFLGVETKTDWRVGSGMEIKGEWQGKPYAAKGVIVAVDRPRLLQHTHWSALSGLPDQPQNYQTVTYRLTPREGGTDLTLWEENIPDAEKKKISEQTWRKVLGALKELVEK